MDQRFKVLTFNIAHGRGLSPFQGLHVARKVRANLVRIARLLNEVDADVIALQEIDENSSWNGNFDHLEYLKNHTRYHHGILGVVNRRAGRYQLNYGNAILSKHPIAAWESLAFGGGKVGEKGFLFAEVEVGSGVLPMVNLHLDYRSRGNRLRQVDQVMEYLSHRHAGQSADWLTPPLVCGDLNNPGTRPDATARLLDYFSRHGHYSLHPAKARTFPSPLPARALDFVFLPPDCQNVRCEVIPTLLSDHRPVLVEFALPGGDRKGGRITKSE